MPDKNSSDNFFNWNVSKTLNNNTDKDSAEKEFYRKGFAKDALVQNNLKSLDKELIKEKNTNQVKKDVGTLDKLLNLFTPLVSTLSPATAAVLSTKTGQDVANTVLKSSKEFLFGDKDSVKNLEKDTKTQKFYDDKGLFNSKVEVSPQEVTRRFEKKNQEAKDKSLTELTTEAALQAGKKTPNTLLDAAFSIIGLTGAGLKSASGKTREGSFGRVLNHTFNTLDNFMQNADNQVSDFVEEGFKFVGVNDRVGNEELKKRNLEKIRQNEDENSTLFSEMEKDELQNKKEYAKNRIYGMDSFSDALFQTGQTIEFKADAARKDYKEATDSSQELFNQSLKQQLASKGYKDETPFGDRPDKIDTTPVKYQGLDGKEYSAPLQNGTDYWDMQELDLDANGQVKLNEKGVPIRKDAYTSFEKVAYGFNGKNIVKNPQFYLTSLLPVMGDAGAVLAVGAMTPNISVPGLSRLGSGGGKLLQKGGNVVTKAAVDEASMASLGVISSNLSKGLGNVLTKSGEKLPQLTSRINSAISQVGNSYLMTSTESSSIGIQTSNKVFENKIDKLIGLDRKEVTETHQALGYEGVELENAVNEYLSIERQKGIKANPEEARLAYDAALTAGKIAYMQNNVFGTVLNLHLAGLLTKTKSFANLAKANPIKNLVGTGVKEAFQESVEEGITNPYSEKLGAELGEGNKFYNLEEYFKKDFFSKETFEGMFLGALMGGSQSTVIGATGLTSDMKSYKEQQEILKEYNRFKTETGIDPKKFIQNTLDKASLDALNIEVNSLLKEADELNKKGDKASKKQAENKLAEANAVAKKATVNRIQQSIKNGVNGQFNDLLDHFVANPNLTVEEKKELSFIRDLSDEMASTFDFYVDRPNRDNIVSNIATQRLNEKRLNEIDEEIATITSEVETAVEEQLKKEGIEVTNPEYTDKKEAAINNDARIDKLNKGKESLSKTQEKYQEELDYETSDKALQDAKEKEYEDAVANVASAEELDNLLGNPEIDGVEAMNQFQANKLNENPQAEKTFFTETAKSQPEDSKNIQELQSILLEAVKEKKANLSGTASNSTVTKETWINDNTMRPSDVKKGQKGIFWTNFKGGRESREKNREVTIKAVSKYGVLFEGDKEWTNFESWNNFLPYITETNISSNQTEIEAKKADEDKPNIIASFNISVDKFSDSQKDRTQELVKNLYDAYKVKNKKAPSFDTFVEMSINELGIEAAEAGYNLIKDSWENLGYNPVKKDVYAKYFSAYRANQLKSIGKEFVDMQRAEDGVKLTSVESPIVTKSEIESVNPDTGEVTVKQNEVTIESSVGSRTIKVNPDTTLHFSAIDFEIKDGKFVDKNPEQLRETDKYNLPYLLDPDNFQKEDEIEYYYAEDGETVLARHKGTELGNVLPTPDWWDNPMNAPGLSVEDREIGKNTNLIIRKGMNENSGKITLPVSHVHEGVTFTFLESKQSLAVNNPDGIIAIKTPNRNKIETTTVKDGKKDFDPSQGIINEGPEGMKDYTPYNLIQSGTRVLESGKVVPVYIAADRLDTVRAEEVPFVVNLFEEVENAAMILKGLKEATQADKIRAERIRDGILKLYNNNANFDIAGKGEATLLSGVSQFNNQRKGKPEFTAIQQREVGVSFILMGKSLPLIAEDGSVTNYKSEITGYEGYDAFLRDTLKTNKKGYPIQNKDGKTIYVHNVQPNIKVDVSSLGVVLPGTKTILKEEKVNGKVEVTETLLQVTNEVEQVTQEIFKENTIISSVKENTTDELTDNDRAAVIDNLFGQILGNIDSSKPVKVKEVMDKISSAIEDYIIPHIQKLTEIRNNTTNESERLAIENTISKLNKIVEEKDSILGLNEFKNNIVSVRKYVSLFFNNELENINEDSTIEFDSNILKDYSKENFEKDISKSFSLELKIMFANIVDTTATSKNKLGLDNYMNPSEVIAHLQASLANLDNNFELFSKVLEDKVKENPSFKFYAQILDKLNNAPEKVRNEMLYKFNLSTLAMDYLEVKNFNGIYSIRVMDANSKNTSIRLKQERVQNFKLSPLINAVGDTYTFNKEVFTEKVDKVFDNWMLIYTKTGTLKNIPNKEFQDYLALFGIVVDDKVIEYLKEKGFGKGYESFDNNFKTSAFKQLRDVVQKNLDKKELTFKEDPIASELSGFIKNILDAQERFITELPSSMYIAGKSINPNIQRNFTNTLISKLKANDKTIRERLSQDEYSKYSDTLRLLDTNPEFRKNFGLRYMSLNAIKKDGDTSSKELGLQDMSPMDLEIYNINFLGNLNGTKAIVDEKWNSQGIKTKTGQMLFPALSDSSQAFILTTVHYDLTLDNMTIDDSYNITSLGDSVKNLLYEQLVKPELNRIIRSVGTDTKISGYNLASKMFISMPFLNSIKKEVELNGRKDVFNLLQYVHGVQDEAKVLEEFKDEIYAALEKYFIDKATQKYQDWLKLGIVTNKGDKGFEAIIDNKYIQSKKTTLEKDTKKALLAVAVDNIVNNQIHNANLSMMIIGDTALYSADKYFKKFVDKNKNPTVIGPYIDTVDTSSAQAGTLDYLNKLDKMYAVVARATSINQAKRLKMFISPGNKLANSAGQSYYQLILNDKELHSNTLQNVVELFYPNLTATQKEELKSKVDELDSLQEKYEAAVESNNNSEAKINEAKIKSSKEWFKNNYDRVSKYLDINTADAQEYTTWKEHLHILDGQGRISTEERLSLYRIHNKLTSQSKDGVNADNLLTESEITTLFQPIKPLYAGEEYLTDSKGNKVRNIVYVKSSSFPLIPQMTKDFKLDGVRKSLEKLQNSLPADKQFVRASYQSANKVGTLPNGIDINRLYDGNITEQELQSYAKELTRDNFYIQQDVPSHFEQDLKEGKATEINIGTQMERINFSEGLNKIEEEIFNNIFDNYILEQVGIENKEKLSGVELDKINKYLYQKEQDLLKQSLNNQFGNGSYVDKIKTLQKKLLEKTTNPQDAEALELVYFKTMPNGIIETFTEKEIEEKGIIPDDAYFKLPLWSMPNSQKIEQYINSIVENSLLKLTLPGNSDVVASQEGFGKPAIVEVDKADISKAVFTSAYTGDLKATHYANGDLKSAQVITGSKFTKRVYYKDENGESKTRLDVVDLKDYADFVDGKYILRTYSNKEMVSLKNELAKAREENDINKSKEILAKLDKFENSKMIADNLLTRFSYRIPSSSLQSGAIIEIVGFLPYESGDLMIVPKDHAVQIGEDYDVDKRYSYHNLYNIEGNKIREIEYEDIAQKISQIEEQIQKIRDNSPLENKLLTAIFSGEEFDTDLEEFLSQADIDKIKTLEHLKAKAEIKVLKNAKVNIYKSIYTTDNKEIQAKINKVLSTDVAENTAEILDEFNQDDSDFSIYDRDYQNKIVKLGASGKLGIGVHSNWVVLNAMFQQTEKNVTLPPLVFGNYSVTGALGNLNKVIPSGDSWYQNNADIFRLISEINGENQNVATDNQKLQVMGRRNENKYTINVFALLSNLGIDMDYYEDENGNKKPIQLSSLFISQPILKRYAELKEERDSVMSKYTTTEIKDILYKEFNIKDNTISNNRLLTGKELYNNLVVYNQDPKKTPPSTQKTVIDLFLELDKQAQEIQKVQQSLSLSKGLGKSFFQTKELYDYLSKPFEFEYLQNSEELYGDIVNTNSIEEGNKLKAQGYLDFGNNYIKPNNITSMKVLNTYHTNYKLWNDVLPITNEAITNIREKIHNSVALKHKNRLETDYSILAALKDFIITDRELGVVKGDIVTLKKKLLLDGEVDGKANTSLAKYVNSIKGLSVFEYNYLVKDFDYSFKNEFGVSTIRHNNNSSKDILIKNKKYNSFNNMINDTTELPSLNGENMTVAKLAEKLVQYTHITEQNQATGFRQYIPIKYLESIGYTKKMQDFNGDFYMSNTTQDVFVQQFFRNNPELVISKKSFENLPKEKSFDIEYYNNGGKLVHVVNGEIPTHKIQSYDMNGLLLPLGVTNEISDGVNFEINQENNLFGFISSLPSNKHTELMKVILPFIDSKTNIVFTDFLNGQKGKSKDGFFVHRSATDQDFKNGVENITKGLGYDKLPIELKRNTIYLKTDIKNKEKLYSLLSHEILHSVTTDELKKYVDIQNTKINSDGTNINVKFRVDENTELPSYVKDLISLYRQSVQEYSKKYGSKYAKEFYPLSNLDEFLVGALTNEEFKVELGKIKVADKTILTKFADAILKLLKSVASSIGTENSILEVTSDVIFQLLVSESAIKEKTNQVSEEELSKLNAIIVEEDNKSITMQKLDKSTNERILLTKEQLEDYQNTLGTIKFDKKASPEENILNIMKQLAPNKDQKELRLEILASNVIFGNILDEQDILTGIVSFNELKIIDSYPKFAQMNVTGQIISNIIDGIKAYEVLYGNTLKPSNADIVATQEEFEESKKVTQQEMDEIFGIKPIMSLSQSESLPDITEFLPKKSKCK